MLSFSPHWHHYFFHLSSLLSSSNPLTPVRSLTRFLYPQVISTSSTQHRLSVLLPISCRFPTQFPSAPHPSMALALVPPPSFIRLTLRPFPAYISHLSFCYLALPRIFLTFLPPNRSQSTPPPHHHHPKHTHTYTHLLHHLSTFPSFPRSLWSTFCCVMHFSLIYIYTSE